VVWIGRGGWKLKSVRENRKFFGSPLTFAGDESKIRKMAGFCFLFSFRKCYGHTFFRTGFPFGTLAVHPPDDAFRVVGAGEQHDGHAASRFQADHELQRRNDCLDPGRLLRSGLRMFRLSCASLLMMPNTCSTRLRTRDLQRFCSFCFGVRGRFR